MHWVNFNSYLCSTAQSAVYFSLHTVWSDKDRFLKNLDFNALWMVMSFSIQHLHLLVDSSNCSLMQSVWIFTWIAHWCTKKCQEDGTKNTSAQTGPLVWFSLRKDHQCLMCTEESIRYVSCSNSTWGTLGRFKCPWARQWTDPALTSLQT